MFLCSLGTWFSNSDTWTTSDRQSVYVYIISGGLAQAVLIRVIDFRFSRQDHRGNDSIKNKKKKRKEKKRKKSVRSSESGKRCSRVGYEAHEMTKGKRVSRQGTRRDWTKIQFPASSQSTCDLVKSWSNPVTIFPVPACQITIFISRV